MIWSENEVEQFTFELANTDISNLLDEIQMMEDAVAETALFHESREHFRQAFDVINEAASYWLEEGTQHLAELEELNGQIAQYEEDLSDPNYAETPAGNELQIRLREVRSKIGTIEHKVSVIDRDIAWWDRKTNSSELMAEYIEIMNNWATDKAELEGKRKMLSTRLAETKSQSEKMITDARQAEEEAARAYAQAVAWSDIEGEKKAAHDAHEAAKALRSATENQRRQALIITAIEQEIETIDVHIQEAVREFEKSERVAIGLASERLTEEWDTAVQRLLDIGAKLYATKRCMGWDANPFRYLKVRSELNFNDSWDWADLSKLSYKHTPEEICVLL
ncbi:MAG: hypothetical protein EOP04_05470 [Proteobacteria bacterium]|nr:MAG: hypothetical protein EOP04_05470 [Pseudomonadota bacterium]